MKSENHYIDNKVFLAALIEYRVGLEQAKICGEELPRVPEYIGECFIKIADHLAHKSNFVNYSFREDMILDAIENCLIYAHNFDPAKSSNPFAYFTQIAYYAFIRRIQKEKRHMSTKNRYVQSLDIDTLIRQASDDGDYGSWFVSYLQAQVDDAERENDPKPPQKMKRMPKYLQKAKLSILDDFAVQIDETEHIDLPIVMADD